MQYSKNDELNGALILVAAIAVCGVAAGAKMAGPVGGAVAILVCGWIALLILFARSNADQARAGDEALSAVAPPAARPEAAPNTLTEALGAPLAAEELDDLSTPA